MMYGRKSLTLDEVHSVLHSRVLQSKLKTKNKLGEGLTVRGRSEKFNPKNNFNKFISKSRNRQLKCFNCHKESHFKKECLKKKNNRMGKHNNGSDTSIVLEGDESARFLNIYEIESNKEWIIDYGCSFHVS